MNQHSSSSEISSWWGRLLIGRRPGVTLVRMVVLAVCAVAIFKFWLLPFRISGISMEPTYLNGQVNFINAFSYWRNPPQRGDVVGIEMTGRSILYMKRIIGLPGETIAIDQGIVYLDGNPAREPYVEERADWNVTSVVLGPETYFVIGDNRDTDQDGHVFGEVVRSKIVGKVLF